MGKEIRFNHAGPQFAVGNIERAVGFYSAVLDFELDYLDGDPPHYAVIHRDEVFIHLALERPPEFPAGAGRAFVAVTGVDRIWDRARSEAPKSIVSPLQDLDYGHQVRFRVFAIRDLDGNSLRIGEPEADLR